MKIWAKTKEFSEGKFLVVRRDGTVPHWPHFVLGARDESSEVALRAYAADARRRGLDPAYCDSIVELANDFDRYRLSQGDGDPDAAPHRIDHPDVIALMRGHACTVHLRPDEKNRPKTAKDHALADYNEAIEKASKDSTP